MGSGRSPWSAWGSSPPRRAGVAGEGLLWLVVGARLAAWGLGFAQGLGPNALPWVLPAMHIAGLTEGLCLWAWLARAATDRGRPAFAAVLVALAAVEGLLALLSFPGIEALRGGTSMLDLFFALSMLLNVSLAFCLAMTAWLPAQARINVGVDGEPLSDERWAVVLLGLRRYRGAVYANLGLGLFSLVLTIAVVTTRSEGARAVLVGVVPLLSIPVGVVALTALASLRQAPPETGAGEIFGVCMGLLSVGLLGSGYVSYLGLKMSMGRGAWRAAEQLVTIAPWVMLFGIVTALLLLVALGRTADGASGHSFRAGAVFRLVAWVLGGGAAVWALLFFLDLPARYAKLLAYVVSGLGLALLSVVVVFLVALHGLIASIDRRLTRTTTGPEPPIWMSPD